jgi:Na+/H+ antiporter NhaD/arsenite permease-like protein
MNRHRPFLAGLAALGLALAAPSPAWAAAGGPPLDLAPLSALPFVALLLCLAVLPVAAPHFWHSNRNQALIAAACAAPVVAYLLWLGPQTGGRSAALLGYEMAHYVSFIVMLASLYTVCGGIVLRGALRPTPLVNTALLAAGAVLTNLIGTTGASMLMIRPFLRVNQARRRNRHLPVFFIFLVGNVGGLLTPLGDPPLFLGFLEGVDFFWTLRLIGPWLLVNGVLLTVFYVWEVSACRGEAPEALARPAGDARLGMAGKLNLLWLAGVLAAVLLQSEEFAQVLHLTSPWPELVMAALLLLSWLTTSRRLRDENGFEWGPILEVAILFAGIFACMVPALELLKKHGSALGLSEPWHFFWAAGLMSSFLDNAPAYLNLAVVAAHGEGFDYLQQQTPRLLEAISCGAVFMGANTYIGNGPNFMIKAVCDRSGLKCPSFFGYMGYAAAVLLPLWVLVTLVFFL